ncbi:MAG: ABC transporter substrate-binding protein [Bacteroidales bacterium]|nr:ABC transporter substrate-binding protein [Bacteroidales bacterium]MBN2821155.1 ABC transporter substrate-binding protein [Bacteroidales bacterium]
MRLTFFCLGFLFLLSCSQTTSKTSSPKLKGNTVKYAKGFSIKDTLGYTCIEVYNPWNNYNLLERYCLVGDSSEYQLENSTVIKLPVKNGVYLSSTFLGMVSALDSRNTVKACSNANWIYDSVLYNDFKNGKISDLGTDLTVSPEPVIALSPDFVMKYIFKSKEPLDEILQKSKIPVLYNIEFMEEHPLGRAEWIKFIGAFTGKKKAADSIFLSIEEKYNRYSELAKTVQVKKTALVGSSYKGTWYAVGGKSYMAKLLHDANIDYFWKIDSSAGGLPLSFESVILNQKDADIWINANASSLNDILSVEARCDIFKSFQKGRVYHYNKRQNENGGLDYYESGVVRPDLLLKDLLLIFYPELITDDSTTTYWKKIE